MSTETKVALCAITAAACIVLLPSSEEPAFPGISPREARQIRRVVAQRVLPRYWPGLSWTALRLLPEIHRMHQQWHIDEMLRGADGAVSVRYTLTVSDRTLSNLVCTVVPQGDTWRVQPTRRNDDPAQTTRRPAPYAIYDLSPTKLEWFGLSFSVEATALTNATRFAVSISSDGMRSLPHAYSATLRTEAEGPVIETRTVNGRSFVARQKTNKEEGKEIGPAITNQADRIAYSFEVPNEKQADAAFMFWVTNPPGPNVLPACCYRVVLKPFEVRRAEK